MHSVGALQGSHFRAGDQLLLFLAERLPPGFRVGCLAPLGGAQHEVAVVKAVPERVELLLESALMAETLAAGVRSHG